MSGRLQRFSAGLAAIFAAALFAAHPAAAQIQDLLGEGPLRFLRPSVEPEDELPAPKAESASPVEAAVPAPNESLPSEVMPSEPALSEVPDPAGAPVDAAPVPAETLQPPAQEPQPQQKQRLRIGVLAGRDAATTLIELEAFAEGLGQALGRPVEILPMASYGAMIDAQLLGRTDGGFYSASAYVLAQSGCQCLEPLAAPAAGDGTTAYHAIIVTPRDSGDDSLADLRGKVVAVAAADSIGARRMPIAALLAEGVEVETFFAGVRDVGSAEQAVRLMVEGEADAAFAWSSLSGHIATGYSRGTLADMVARGAIAMDEIAVVWRSPPITHGPFAASSAVSDAEKATIEAYLLGLEQNDPTAYDALNPFYAGGYAAVDMDDYSGVGMLAEQQADAQLTETPAPPIAPDPPAP